VTDDVTLLREVKVDILMSSTVHLMVVQFSDRPGGFDSVILKAHTQRETGGRSIVLHRCVQWWRTPCRVSLTSSRFITWRKEGRKWRLTYQIAWHR